MKDFLVKLRISAECEDDARELLDYTGQETDIEIIEIKPWRKMKYKIDLQADSLGNVIGMINGKQIYISNSFLKGIEERMRKRRLKGKLRKKEQGCG